MHTCPAACGRAREAPYYPTVAVPRVTQRSAEHAARVGRRGHEALLHGLRQVLERARGVVEEDRVGLAVGADCAPRGASTCEAAARATGDGAAAARACTVAGGGGVCGGEGAPSRIMSKYCVTIMRSMTVLASTSCTWLGLGLGFGLAYVIAYEYPMSTSSMSDAVSRLTPARSCGVHIVRCSSRCTCSTGAQAQACGGACGGEACGGEACGGEACGGLGGGGA